MSKIVDWVKEHPYETGALIIVVGGAAFLILESSSGGAAQTSSQSGDSSAADYYQAQLQAAQISAQESAAANAAQSQTNQTAIAAQVQNNELAAQLAATEDQDQAAIQAAQINAGVTNNQTSAQVDVAKLQANVANTTTEAGVTENSDNLNALLGIVGGQDQVQIAETQAQVQDQYNNDALQENETAQQYGYLNNEVNSATAVNLTQLNDATAIQSQQDATIASFQNGIIPLLGTGSNSFSQTLLAALTGMEGNSGSSEMLSTIKG